MCAGRWYAVVDGKDGPDYDGIGADGVAFSPDSRRFAYTPAHGADWPVVLDGVEIGTYEQISLVHLAPIVSTWPIGQSITANGTPLSTVWPARNTTDAFVAPG